MMRNKHQNLRGGPIAVNMYIKKNKFRPFFRNGSGAGISAG